MNRVHLRKHCWEFSCCTRIKAFAQHAPAKATCACKTIRNKMLALSAWPYCCFCLETLHIIARDQVLTPPSFPGCRPHHCVCTRWLCTERCARHAFTRSNIQVIGDSIILELSSTCNIQVMSDSIILRHAFTHGNIQVMSDSIILRHAFTRGNIQVMSDSIILRVIGFNISLELSSTCNIQVIGDSIILRHALTRGNIQVISDSIILELSSTCSIQVIGFSIVLGLQALATFR